MGYDGDFERGGAWISSEQMSLGRRSGWRNRIAVSTRFESSRVPGGCNDAFALRFANPLQDTHSCPLETKHRTEVTGRSER